MSTTTFTRRRFIGAMSMTALAAACGSQTTPAGARATSVGIPTPAADSSAIKLVSDVVDFKLRGPYSWLGGSVTLKLHPAFFNGQTAYFVRTDSSDLAFAKQEGLVHVPLLNAALAARPAATADLFLFADGASGQLPVLSTVPGTAGFTSLYVINRVRSAGAKAVLDSAEKIRAAQRSGAVVVEATKTVVNYPIVQWPGGALPVDAKVEKALEGGPLLGKPDTEKLTVMFKLHQCFPESRYIVTDTSAVPMAPMMNVTGSPATAGLIAAGATSKITVFGNGLSGPGAMGFQPAIFQAKAGDAAWSPMWDHWTALWKDPTKAVLLRKQDELDARVAAGEIALHHGTPDTKGEGFVVNCPSPIVAPNDFVAR
jgi:hypothetical protein